MSNKRWGSDDKIELMRLYASGRSYEEIGKTLDRSPNAIKLRLESIIYENLIKGKPIKLLTRMLNTDVDTIKQFYYSHKSFLQGCGKEVHDITFPTDNNGIIENQDNHSVEIIGGDSHEYTNHAINYPKNYDTAQNSVQHNIQHQTVIKHDKNNNDTHKSSSKRLRYIENENHVLEEIIKNYKMKRQIRKLYVDDKLDEKSREIYEKLLKISKKH